MYQDMLKIVEIANKGRVYCLKDHQANPVNERIAMLQTKKQFSFWRSPR